MQNSLIYNDFGRSDTFHYALANGVYNITIGLQKTGDISFCEIEGLIVWNASVPAAGVTEFSKVRTVFELAFRAHR